MVLLLSYQLDATAHKHLLFINFLHITYITNNRSYTVMSLGTDTESV